MVGGQERGCAIKPTPSDPPRNNDARFIFDSLKNQLQGGHPDHALPRPRPFQADDARIVFAEPSKPAYRLPAGAGECGKTGPYK